MLVSHKHRFIFIKTFKTAGTSLEIVLAKHCGAEDIITPVTPEDEPLRAKIGSRKPQNYIHPTGWFRRPYRDFIWNTIVSVRNGKIPSTFHEHISATRVRNILGDEIWSKYFKFTIVRNPYDRIVSLYYWHINSTNEPDMDFDYFLRTYTDKIVENWKIISERDRFILDSFARFEHAEIDLDLIAEKIGIPEKIYEEMAIISAKRNVRPKHGLTAETLSSKQREFIAFLCAPEFKQFGYNL